MKNNLKISLQLLFLLISFIFISSCEKDKQSNGDNLMAADWSLRSSVSIPGYVIGSDTITEMYSIMDTCEKDNILRFFQNDIVSIDAGVIKCDSLEPQGTQGTWMFLENETKMVFYNDTINIIEITADKLTISYIVDSLPTAIQTVTNTYENIK